MTHHSLEKTAALESKRISEADAEDPDLKRLKREPAMNQMDAILSAIHSLREEQTSNLRKMEVNSNAAPANATSAILGEVAGVKQIAPRAEETASEAIKRVIALETRMTSG